MLKQNKIDSLLESSTNIAIGLSVTLTANYYVLPLVFDIEVTHADNLILGVTYTAISLVRSYAIRRAFNGRSVYQSIKGLFVKAKAPAKLKSKLDRVSIDNFTEAFSGTSDIVINCECGRPRKPDSNLTVFGGRTFVIGCSCGRAASLKKSLDKDAERVAKYLNSEAERLINKAVGITVKQQERNK